MGRGYLTVAIRRTMGYPMRGYVPMNIRQSVSANENESLVNTIKIDDDDLNNQPQIFTPIETSDIDEKIAKNNLAMNELQNERSTIDYLAQDEDSILYPEIMEKINKLDNKTKKLYQKKKDLFFKDNPEKIDENSVKNISLINLEKFNFAKNDVLKDYYTAEERKMVADETEKRYRNGFIKQYPGLSKVNDGDIERYIPLFKKIWRKQNGFPY
jgi:actin-related protein